MEPRYSVGADIMCEFKGVAYKAKIMEIMTKREIFLPKKGKKSNKINTKILDENIQATDLVYLVHYMQWNKKWDEWVAESQISIDKDHQNNQHIVSGKGQSKNVSTPLKKSSKNVSKNKKSTEKYIDLQQEASNSTVKEEADAQSTIKPILNKDVSPIIIKREKDDFSHVIIKSEKVDDSQEIIQSQDDDNDNYELDDDEPNKTAESTNIDLYVTCTEMEVDEVNMHSTEEEVSLPNAQSFEKKSGSVTDNEKVDCDKTLASILKLDFQQIKQRNMLIHTMPKLGISIETLLNDYVASVKKTNNLMDSSKAVEFTDGLRSYIAATLNTKFLYKEEREVYSKAVSMYLKNDEDSTEKCKVFAPIYILRLMCKIDDLYKSSSINASSAAEGLLILGNEKIKFLAFLEKNIKKYFPESVYYRHKPIPRFQYSLNESLCKLTM